MKIKEYILLYFIIFSYLSILMIISPIIDNFFNTLDEDLELEKIKYHFF